jgi:hypothetical protein
MFKKIYQIAMFLFAVITCVSAEGFTIYCPLDLKTDDHLYRDFVQNCGARVEDINPEIFQIGFASLYRVEKADAATMNAVVTKWVTAHQNDFKGLSLDLSDVKLEGQDIFITTTFLCNQLYTLRENLQKHINCTKFPSGKTYDLDANTKGFHLFSIITADTTGLKKSRIYRATQILRDRLHQAKDIYHDEYTQVTLTAPIVKIM